MKDLPARGALAAGVFTLLLVGSGCIVGADVGSYVERDEKHFTVSGDADVTVGTFDGAIEVRPWDKPEVAVVIEKRGRDAADIEEIDVRSEQSDTHIVVEAKRRKGATGRMIFGWNRQSAKLIVSLPASASLKATSGDGSIDVERLTGHVDLSSGDGRIRARDVTGDVSVRTGDGSITLGGRLSTVHARTGDGRVTIHVDEGSTPAGDWDVTTGDGSVTFELPDSFDAELDAHTGDGRVRVNGVTVSNVSGEMGKNSLRGRLGAGGKLVRVRTGDGSITLKKF